MSEYSCFHVRHSGDVTIVDIISKALTELVFQEQLYDELMDLVAKKAPIRLVVNMAGVEMIGSEAIGVLINVRKALVKDQGLMAFCGVEPNVRASFQVLNLEGTLFTVCESEEAAVKEVE